MRLKATASQTVGPFFHLGFDGLTNGNFLPAGERGEPITVQGRVLDGDLRPVPDAVLEFWQANSAGQYAGADETCDKSFTNEFSSFARIPTDEDGFFRLETIKPGQIPGPSGFLQAPHIVVTIFMRGLLKQLITRIYFPGETTNGDDPVLNLVPPERHSTLVSKRLEGIEGALEWNVILQGKEETVFFEW